MREVFDDIFTAQPLDPTESARRNMRALKRRFYTTVEVGEGAHGFALTLDGRLVRTPARRVLAAPHPVLAGVIAAEWRAQGEHIDPAGMPMTRLANSIIDGVAAVPQEVAGEVAKYLGSDLLVYRAASPAGLVAQQAKHWDPVLEWARGTFGAPFVTTQGVIHVAQPASAVAAARAAIPRDPWRLGALHSITTLTGSALLGLAVAAGALDRDAAWAAAHVDEDWNMDFWGRDELAVKRRAFRHAEMIAADLVLTHAAEKAAAGTN